MQERQKNFARKYVDDYKERLEKLEDEFDRRLALISKDDLSHKDRSEVRNLAKEKLDEAYTQMQGFENPRTQKLSTADLKIGDKVFIISLNREAYVVKIEERRVEVESGFMRVKVNIHDLKR